MNVPAAVETMKEALSEIPPDFAAAERLFGNYQPTEEELMWLAVELIENTYDEYLDKTPGAAHRDFLCQTIGFLLEHGLNPNTVYGGGTPEEDDAMSALKFVYGPDEGAKTMRLLLEHGGDPNLPTDFSTPFGWIDTELGLEPIDPMEDKDLSVNFVQCLLVMQAYGGRFEDGAVPFVMREGYRSDIFKNFEDYDYWIGTDAGHPGLIHVFEKATGKIVADYV